MAVHDNTVTVVAGLNCTALTSPPIGSNFVSATMAYTDGDPALDTYVSVTATTIPGTALHTDLGANGFVFVYNPSTNSGAVTLYVGTTELGPISPGFPAVIPVSSGAVVKAVSATTQSVGVTAIKTTPNSA